jgi:hypothetical protein
MEIAALMNTLHFGCFKYYYLSFCSCMSVSFYVVAIRWLGDIQIFDSAGNH